MIALRTSDSLTNHFNKIFSDTDIQTSGNFIQQENFEQSNQPQHQLNTSSLTITQLMHPPVRIDSQQFDEFGRLQFFHHFVLCGQQCPALAEGAPKKATHPDRNRGRRKRN
jgi:hypothetical protein